MKKLLMFATAAFLFSGIAFANGGDKTSKKKAKTEKCSKKEGKTECCTKPSSKKA